MSEKELLNVKDLVVDVEEKEILHGVNLTIRPGETHVLMGPNGTGKSTLGYTLLGNPRYTVKQGEIRFDGKNITAEPVNERAKAGIFLSFQNPLEVPGIPDIFLGYPFIFLRIQFQKLLQFLFCKHFCIFFFYVIF